MSNGKIQEYLRHIGSIVAIFGGVLAAMQSIESAYEALGVLAFASTSALSAGDVLPYVLHSAVLGVMGLLAGGLSIVLTWFALLAFESPDKKYGRRIIFCASVPIALGIVALIIIGIIFRNDSNTEIELTTITMQIRAATQAMGNIFEYSSLAVVGGVLILLSASKKLQRVIERQRAESPDK